MVRPYAIKGRKRKKRESNYDREDEQQQEQLVTEEINIEEMESKLDDHEGEAKEAKKARLMEDELPGIPLAPLDQKNRTKNGVIFILEKASLEVAKIGKNYQILSSDEHGNFLRKNNRNPADYRPDIVYQALLNILDSPLNKAGRLKAVYVKTEKGVLFEIKPHVRLPRTYKRFAGIMLQLLQKLSITAVGKRERLLHVIKNPVTQYLPLNSRKIGFSHSSEKLVTMTDYVSAVDDDTNLVFVVGAMSHGKIANDYTDDYVSISEYPLSAAWCIARICEAMQQKWKIH